MKNDFENEIIRMSDARNKEGYSDPCPYFAMRNEAETLRFRRFINVIFKVAQLCGFYITGAITVTDNFTGQEFRWIFKPRR